MFLTKIAPAVAAAQELTRSPLNNFRALGWAMNAWLSAFGSPENVDEFLARSENEHNEPTKSDTQFSDTHTAAATWALLSADCRIDERRFRAVTRSLS